MAVVRILVDGFSLLHHWPALAPGAPRHSVQARDELVHILTQYSDACRIPITIIFDGSRPPGGPVPRSPRHQVEVLYSTAGRTADNLIERITAKMKPYGEVLVVTDDVAERETVLSLGGSASSCLNFVHGIEGELAELELDLRRHNLRERTLYRQGNRSGGS